MTISDATRTASAVAGAASSAAEEWIETVCNLLRTGKRKTVTLVGAGIGTLLAIGGMYEMLIPFLILLGSVIPPIGGVIMADYFYGHRARYPKLADVRLPAFNWVGLGAYLIGALSAYFSPWVAPLVGIAVAAVVYVVLFELHKALAGRQQVAGA